MPKEIESKFVYKAKDQTGTATRSAKKNFKSLAESAKTNFGLISTIAVTAFAAATKEALSFADEIGKMANRAGITTDALQEMRFAFDKAGISVADVDKSFLQFGKRLGKARAGFGALEEGLKRVDPELLANIKNTNSNTEALQKLFEGMSQTTDQAKKLAIADAAFGRSGLKMTAAFQAGSDAFNENIKLARELGVVLDKNLIESAEKTKDQFAAVSEVLKTQFVTVMLEIAPILSATAQGILNVTKEIILFKNMVLDAATGANTLSEYYAQLKKKANDLRASINVLNQAGTLSPLNPLSKIKKQKEEDLILTNRKIKQIEDLAKHEKLLVQANKRLLEGNVELGISAQKATEDLQGMLDLITLLATAGASPMPLIIGPDYKLSDAAPIAQDPQFAEDLARSLGIVEDLFDDTTEAAKLYQEQIDALNFSLDSGKISIDTWVDGMDLAKSKYKETLRASSKLLEVTNELGFTFSSAFEDAVAGGEDFSDILVGLEEDLRRLMLRLLVIEPLLGVFKDFLFEASLTDFSGLFGGLFGGSSGVTDGSIDAHLFDEGDLPIGGDAPVNVIINNNSGSSVSTKESRNSQGGRDLTVMIGEAVADDFRRGGPASRAAKNVFGLKNQPMGR